MQTITDLDLQLFNDLSSRVYHGNTMSSNCSEEERARFNAIKHKLGEIAEFFSAKYIDIYGPFITSISSGNPIAYGGTHLNNLWSGFYKGPSKQYAAQISFVMDRYEKALNVGFYFGRASGHSLTKEVRKNYETQLNKLGIILSDTITNTPLINNRYRSLFDYGFKAYSYLNEVSPDEWINIIRTHTANSHISTKIYPNSLGEIEISTIDSFIAQVIFLMGALNSQDQIPITSIKKPLSPEQRAKQAERLAQIGLDGELFVMEQELEKLTELGLDTTEYPKHVALESDSYGYDVLSLDENKDEIYIEVKTTTRTAEDPLSNKFFISNYEIHIFQDNTDKYRLYRVLDVYDNPTINIIDLETVNRTPNGYIVEY